MPNIKHIIPISGKDSLTTALVQIYRQPEISYSFFFNDTGCELPPTYEWLERVEEKTGWKIQRIGFNLESLINKYGGFLPSRNARYCTSKAKIQPMEKEIKLGKPDSVFIYYGLIRADENRTGYVPIASSVIKPVYPLQEMGIDLQGVWAILDAQDLRPPTFFWYRLYEAVNKNLEFLGDWESQASLLPWERHTLFAGRTRGGNCYFCFFQRIYEYVWLYETYPALFYKALSFEKTDYSWRSDYRMSEFEDADFREHHFQKRVRQICKLIIERVQGKFLYETGDNEISLKSCGLLCGK